MANPIVLGKLGMEDIAFGTGVQAIDLGGGHFKTLTEVNLSNMPFDETKTVGEALTEFQTLLTNQKYEEISQELPKLIKLSENLTQLTKLESSMESVNQIKDSLDGITALALSLPTLMMIPSDLAYLQQIKRDSLYIRCDVLNIQKSVSKAVSYVDDITRNKLHPLDTKMDIMEQRLTSLLATAVATVVNGNTMAMKFSTYTLMIQPVISCSNPKFIIDDDNMRLIWQVPKSVCYNLLPEPTNEALVEAVTSYFQAGGDGGGSGYDELVTQEEVNQAVLAWIDAEGQLAVHDVAMTQEEVCNIVGVDC